MKVLDLFSGIGGFSLGLERAGMETIAFCEIEEFPRKVLEKHWPDVPIAGDIKKLTYKNWALYDDGKEIYRGAIDVICGGYPCQPFSVAGKRAGATDDRHLWPEYLRLIREIRPKWIIAENVAGHITMGIDEVLTDLENEDYAWGAYVIPASGIYAPHKRDRVWIVANTASKRVQGLRSSWEQELRAHAEPPLPLRESKRQAEAHWEAEPDVDRVVDGIPNRVDRIKGLGNAVVPQIPEIIGRAVINIEKRAVA